MTTSMIQYRSLRERVERESPADDAISVSADELRALLDIAEAAYRANFDAPCGYCEKNPDDCPNTRLRSSLDKVSYW